MSVQKSKAKVEDTESILEIDQMESSDDMQDAYENLVDELVEEVINGHTSDQFEELMHVLAVSGSYSTRNKYLIRAQNPDVIGPFNGYKQWINEFGRIPEKGSDALWILAPVIVQYCDESDEKVKYCSDCDGECESTRKVMVDCKSVTTFAYSQTVELPEEDQPEDTKDISVISQKSVRTSEDTETVEEWYANLQTFYENEGFIVNEVSEFSDWDVSSGARGYFEHSDRNVTVRNFRIDEQNQSVDVVERFSTLVHEVAHSLLRHDESDLSNGQIEMEAEAVAYVVCQRLNIESESGVYISSHLRSETDLSDRSQVRSIVTDSIERIGDVSGEILEAIRE